MSLMFEDKQLLKNYNQIWKKMERLMSIDFSSKTTYGNDDDKHIKTKIKTYSDITITNFHNKKMPKEKVPCKCLSIQSGQNLQIPRTNNKQNETWHKFRNNISKIRKNPAWRIVFTAVLVSSRFLQFLGVYTVQQRKFNLPIM